MAGVAREQERAGGDADTRRLGWPLVVGVITGAVAVALLLIEGQALFRAASPAPEPFILAAPAVVAMLVAAIRSQRRRFAPLAALGFLAAVLLVLLATVPLDRVRPHLLDGWQLGLLGFAIIGFWLALACAYAAGAAATTTSDDLNDGVAGWAGFSVALLVALLIAGIGGMHTAHPTGHGVPGDLLTFALVGICGGAVAAAFVVALTTALLGGWLGGLLRRGLR